MRLAARLTAAAVALTGIAGGTLIAVQVSAPGHASADEITMSQNQLRNAWDASEPGLSPQNLASGSFGQLFATHVDGQVYAQPLVIHDATGASRVIAATEADTVYSLDGTTGDVKWSANLGTPWASSVTAPCTDLTPQMGITSTPAYDPATGTLYVVAVTTGGNPTVATPTISLFALSAADGTTKWSKVISGSPSNDPSMTFNPAWERQRAGLLLLDGSVYFAFGSICDLGNYSGYIAGVNTTNQAETLWTDEAGTSSADPMAGMWQSGGALMSDGPGRIFVVTGNGISPPAGPGTMPPGQLGDAVVRLDVQPDGSLTAGDFFSPANADTLNTNDKDLGSGSPVGLPYGTSTYPHLVVAAGKQDGLFLLNRDSLGGREQGPGGADNPVSVYNLPYPHFGHPTAFAGDGGANYLYVTATGYGAGDYMRMLKFDGSNPGAPVFTPVANSPSTFGFSSGSPVITSTGTDPASAVVWNVYTAKGTGAGGTLKAFAAIPDPGSPAVLPQLWSAPIGTAVKFSVPATNDGRVYVGSRDDGTGNDPGHGMVFGFGVTSAAPFTGAKPVDFGNVQAGSAAGNATVTLTAAQAVHVSGVKATAPFAAGTPSLDGTPVTGSAFDLSAGQQLTIPVTFRPTATGGATGALAIATNAPGYPTMGVPLTGAGTEPGLTSTEAKLVFGTANDALGTSGDVPVGLTDTQVTDIVNTGTLPEKVASITRPTAPFTISGLSTGQVLQPGQSVSVNVTFQPTSAGTSSSTFTVAGEDGTPSTVSLTGTSVAGNGQLAASAATVDFGQLAIGRSAVRSVTLTNNGNLPVTITKFTAPGVPFGTPVPVATGLAIPPGDTIKIPVTFTPQAKGAMSGQYQLVTTDGQHAARTVTVAVTGQGYLASGVIPSPGGGWTLNGSAQMSGSTLALTPAAVGKAGSAVFYQPEPADGLKATFTARLNGGTGADGMTFALINPSDTTSALGGGGGLLGFGGKHGVAVVLVTHQATGDPSGNFVGIATGTTGTGSAAHLVYRATSSKVPNLRSGTHSVAVAVSGTTMTVKIDGTQYLSAPVSLPASVLPMFSAATGGLTDVHAVSGVSLTTSNGNVPPPGGGWSYNGAAVMGGSDTVLTHAVTSQAGTVIYPRAVSTTSISATFNAQIGGGTGADGMSFALLDPTTNVSSVGGNGSGLGLAGLPGIGVTLVTHQAAGDPSNNYVAITAGTQNGQPFIKSSTSTIPQLRSGTHTVTITLQAGQLTVYLDGVKALSQTMTGLPSKMLLAFTAGTGAVTDNHLIRNAAITATGLPEKRYRIGHD